MTITMVLNMDPGVTDLGAAVLGKEISQAIMQEFEDDVLTIEVTISGHKVSPLRLHLEPEDKNG